MYNEVLLEQLAKWIRVTKLLNMLHNQNNYYSLLLCTCST